MDAEFGAAEQAIASPGQTHEIAPVSLAVLTEYLRSHEQIDQRSAQRLLSDPPDSEEQRCEMRMDAEIATQILRNRDDPRASEWVMRTSNEVLSSANARLVGDMTVAQFEETVRRGLLELAARKIDRLDDVHDRTHHDNLFDPQRAPSVTFGELADVFGAERLTSYETNNVNQKRIDKVKAELSFIREAVGDSTSLSSINDDTVQHVRGLLAALPANRRKFYPKQGIVQAIERGQKEGKRVIDPVTQARYLDCLRDVLTVGVRKQYLRGNPSNPSRSRRHPRQPGARPCRSSRLSRSLPGASTSPSPPTRRSPTQSGTEHGGSGYRWSWPFQGRDRKRSRNSCGQMFSRPRTAHGTSEDEDAEATPKGAEKTVKTGSSRRRIPLHPELIKIGFLGFVNQQKKKAGHKNRRLFPDLKPDHYGNVATYANRRFNEVFLPAEITLAKNQVFYSFRHSVRDAMRRAKVPAETLLIVTGWSPAGKAVSDDYGDPGNPDLHIEWVEKIGYPGLDLTFLHGTGIDV